ncbi:thioredoxin-like protein [Aspergillus crustosus]
MSLAEQLVAVTAGFKDKAPEAIRVPIVKAKLDFEKYFDLKSTIQVGDRIPDFRLTNAVGEEVSSADLRAHGPLLITFYRGSWCPYCNLALGSLQKHLTKFQEQGVALVAITPELPDYSLSLAEKHDLKFPVLTDRGNDYAKQLGLIFQMPDALRPAFEKFGHDLVEHNGDDSFSVPVPATLLVDKGGVVRNAFIDADYSKRLEPTVALEWIEKLDN